MKTAIIDPGGGMKGIFCAGVTDALLEEGILFDLYAGVSAGSANLASYACKQRGRTRRFYLQYAMRPEYMSLSNFVHKKSYFDFDYIFSTLSDRNGEDPLQVDVLKNSPSECLFVTTNALSGRPMYFDKSDIWPDHYDVFKTSCSIPWLCTTRVISSLPACDGTLSDPLPIEKVLKEGADKIVLILPSGLEEDKEGPLQAAMVSLLRYSRKTSSQPGLARALENRPSVYNHSVEVVRKLEQEGRLLCVTPDHPHHVTALSRNTKELEALYEDGLHQAQKIRDFLQTPVVFSLAEHQKRPAASEMIS